MQISIQIKLLYCYDLNLINSVKQFRTNFVFKDIINFIVLATELIFKFSYLLLPSLRLRDNLPFMFALPRLGWVIKFITLYDGLLGLGFVASPLQT